MGPLVRKSIKAAASPEGALFVYRCSVARNEMYRRRRGWLPNSRKLPPARLPFRTG
jgi:hypothetical protein